MNISKSTIVRTIMMVIVLVNLLLERCGVDLIPADEHLVTTVVEYIIEAAVIVVCFWKNNSFSPEAIKADEFLKRLRESK